VLLFCPVHVHNTRHADVQMCRVRIGKRVAHILQCCTFVCDLNVAEIDARVMEMRVGRDSLDGRPNQYQLANLCTTLTERIWDSLMIVVDWALCRLSV
jgi:hypothetical protein